MRKILLVLLLVVCVFASDEIGVPVIDWKKAQIESAVLALDGKSFYTLQETELIQWNLSPLKKLNQWQVPLKEITTGKQHNRFHDIWFLDNYTKVLITSIEGMMIYDLKTHKVDKQVEYANHSLVRDGDFIYLTHPTRIQDGRYNIDLEKWSIPELERVKSVNITEMGRKHISTCCGPEDINSVEPCNTDCPIENLSYLVLGKNNMYYHAVFGDLLIIDKKTLEFKSLGEYYNNNFEILEGGYLNTGSAIYRLSDDKHIDYRSRGWGYKKDFDLKVIQDLCGKPKRYSVVDNLYLKAQKSGYPYMFAKQSTKQHVLDILIQFKGELVIKRRGIGKPLFESSSRHIELLEMRNEEKQIVPMNDATYNKYHTNFNIGVN